MRTWILAIVLLAACKGKDKGVASKEAVKAALAVPKVDVASVLAKDDGTPPVLVIVEDAGVRLAAAESWTDFDAGKLKITKKPGQLDHLDRYLREGFALDQPPSKIVASVDEIVEGDIDLSMLEDTSTRAFDEDDPPPPEEDDPEEGEEEGLTIDEDKLSERTEGQYRMKKNQEDPQLARQQAIEQARAAGILGGLADVKTPGLGFGALVRNEDGAPSRVAKVQGVVKEDGKLDRLRALISIAPAAPATKLIDAVSVTDGAIAVVHAGKVRPLRLQFLRRTTGEAPQRWLEVRVSTKGIVVEAVPDVPIEVGKLAELAPAIDKARKTRGAKEDAPVDVLVEADVHVQRLIDVIVALDTAGVRLIGLGERPIDEELALRGRRMPTVTLARPNAQGDLDKAEIRRVVQAAQPKLHDCYTKALASKPDLAGTVQTQFFITPKGKVASATANGVDPELSTCVAGVVKSLEFPKPQGGGGVQVNYPFTMRP